MSMYYFNNKKKNAIWGEKEWMLRGKASATQMVWVLVAVETVTLNCPTFCELLPCSAGLVLGLDSAFPGCGHVARAVWKWKDPAAGQGPQGGSWVSFWLPLPFQVSCRGCWGPSRPVCTWTGEPARSPLIPCIGFPSASVEYLVVLLNQFCPNQPSFWRWGPGRGVGREGKWLSFPFCVNDKDGDVTKSQGHLP